MRRVPPMSPRTPARRGRSGVGVVLGLLLALALPGTAGAGENDVFGAGPQRADTDGGARSSFVVPEQTEEPQRDGLRVYNRTDEPLTLQVYAAAAELGEDGVYAVGFAHEQEGLAGRIEPATRSVELAPRAEALVPFTLRPGDTPDGLAALVVEPARPRAAGAVDLVERVAILVRTTASGPGNLAQQQAPDGGAPAPAVVAIVAFVALLGLVAYDRLRDRRPASSDEAPDEVPDEDRTGQVHERVHAAPPAS